MIELCFDDSVKGLIRSIHSRARAGEKQQEEEPKILLLPLVLSTGGIAGFAEEPNRWQDTALMQRKMMMERWGDLDRMDAPETIRKFSQKRFEMSVQAIENLLSASAQDEVRIWAEWSPDTICGMMFACNLLEKSGASVCLMPLPIWSERNEKTAVLYKGWGEVSPEEWQKMNPKEILLSKLAVGVMSRRWKELCLEDAPLRTLVNGRIISVGADFYDSILLQEIPCKEIQMAEVMGRIISKGLGLSYGWLCQRLTELIDSGEILLTETGKDFCRDKIMRKIS